MNNIITNFIQGFTAYTTACGCDVGMAENAYFGFKWSCVLFLMNSWWNVISSQTIAVFEALVQSVDINK